jgi:AraC-like DNA-binding protein
MEQTTFTTDSLHLHAFDPEQLLEVVRGARFEHYILGRANLDVRLQRWSSGTFNVDIGRYNFAVRVVGPFPKRRLCVGYMRSLTEPTWVNGFQADQHTLEFYPEGAELNYRASRNGEWVAVEFDEHALQAAARERLKHELDLPWKHPVSFYPPPAGRLVLDGLIRRLWQHPVSGALMIEPILETIAEFLNDLRFRSPIDAQESWFRHQSILKRADQFLRANLQSPFDLRSLASAVGTTERTLQREFIHAYGMTPQGWARCLALHRVRRRLLGSDGKRLTVEAIARECGFRHMGRFASYYLQLFGEYPSRTLRCPP